MELAVIKDATKWNFALFCVMTIKLFLHTYRHTTELSVCSRCSHPLNSRSWSSFSPHSTTCQTPCLCTVNCTVHPVRACLLTCVRTAAIIYGKQPYTQVQLEMVWSTKAVILIKCRPEKLWRIPFAFVSLHLFAVRNCCYIFLFECL